ncbi:MAG: UDP-N-acetylglucosamine 2-epimerase [Pseudomonadota bacterium]
MCVVLVDRANYGRMFSVMKAIQQDEDLELLTMCSGSMLLERFGHAEKVVEQDGFTVDSKVYIEIEGSLPVTMAKSIGVGVIEFSSEFQRLSPDLVLIIGDRYEALAAAVSAAYMNLPLAHIQGGEVSGSIDESARHVITKLAHLHFPSTARSSDYIIRMGENPQYVHNVGCPVGDYILTLDDHVPKDYISGLGVGGNVDIQKPYLLVIFHPVTTDVSGHRDQAQQLITALDSLAFPTIWIWPNIDAGSDQISKAIRVYRENNDSDWLHLVKNMEPEVYQKVLKNAACAVGNSSSFIRDSSFSGTPVVIVGDRQTQREHGQNVSHCQVDSHSISATIKHQLEHGRYKPEGLYGNGNASQKIVDIIKKFQPYNQKILHYPLAK